jgi:hypothetical protein
VPTGFLQVFRTDAELATMIAHEVGLFAQWADACVLWDCSPENSNRLIVALHSFLRPGTSLRGTGQRRSSTGSVFPNPSGCPSSEGIFTCIYINFLCWLSNTGKQNMSNRSYMPSMLNIPLYDSAVRISSCLL